MKKYSRVYHYQKMNKRWRWQKAGNDYIQKKGIWIVMLLVYLIWMLPSGQEMDILYEMTTRFLPLLTYQTEYGRKDMHYADDYDVPSWFYEDEGMTMEKAEQKPQTDRLQEKNDMAGKEEEGEKKKQEETVTTLMDGSNGITYERSQLEQKDFLTSKIFVVDSNTSMTDEELNLKNLLDQDLSISGLKDWDGDRKEKPYQILIYHTHASESFVDSRAGKTEDTIVGVGSYLSGLLEEEYDIPVYHDTTAYDMVDGVLDRNKAYENACQSVSEILKEYPSIQVVIDLHRDGVDEETHLVTDINGKQTAKIMFLNGVSRSNLNGEIAYLENPNKLTNLAFSFQMYLTGKQYYGDYVRKIYVKSLRFNLHLMPRATLIEVGAQTNTLQEEKNAMEPLAAILNQVLSGKEEKGESGTQKK